MPNPSGANNAHKFVKRVTKFFITIFAAIKIAVPTFAYVGDERVELFTPVLRQFYSDEFTVGDKLWETLNKRRAIGEPSMRGHDLFLELKFPTLNPGNKLYTPLIGFLPLLFSFVPAADIVSKDGPEYSKDADTNLPDSIFWNPTRYLIIAVHVALVSFLAGYCFARMQHHKCKRLSYGQRY